MTFRPLVPALLGLAALALAACDPAAPGSTPDALGRSPERRIVFDGVTYIATGSAFLRETDAGLTVESAGDPARRGGVRVDLGAGLIAANIALQPVELPGGARFGLQLFTDGGGRPRPLAAVWIDGEIGTTGSHTITAEYDDALGVEAVVFEYLLADSLVYRSPPVPLEVRAAALAAASGGTTNSQGTSTHATRNSKGVIVVGTDYASGGRAASGACRAALIRTPFEIGEVCADFVRAVPLIQQPLPPPTALAVTGFGVVDFTITSETTIEFEESE